MNLDTSVAHLLKEVTWALRLRLDSTLRDVGLTVPQWATLEVLAHHPGVSNAELARRVFVTRQATHQVLAGLKRDGLVATSGIDRHQRLRLTADGARRRAEASHAVAVVEERMLAGLDPHARADLRQNLAACVRALGVG